MPLSFGRRFTPTFNMRQFGDTMHVAGTDLVYKVPARPADTDGTIATIPANPVYWTGTRIANIATSFQSYRPLRFFATYVPTVSAVQSGQVIYGTIWASAPDQSNLQQNLTTSNGGGSVQAFREASTVLTLGTNLSRNLYEIAGEVNQTTNPFTFTAIAVDTDGKVPGYFYISYEYVFKNPVGEGLRVYNSGPINLASYTPMYPNRSLILTTPLYTSIGVLGAGTILQDDQPFALIRAAGRAPFRAASVELKYNGQPFQVDAADVNAVVLESATGPISDEPVEPTVTPFNLSDATSYTGNELLQYDPARTGNEVMYLYSNPYVAIVMITDRVVTTLRHQGSEVTPATAQTYTETDTLTGIPASEVVSVLSLPVPTLVAQDSVSYATRDSGEALGTSIYSWVRAVWFQRGDMGNYFNPKVQFRTEVQYSPSGNLFTNVITRVLSCLLIRPAAVTLPSTRAPLFSEALLRLRRRESDLPDDLEGSSSSSRSAAAVKEEPDSESNEATS